MAGVSDHMRLGLDDRSPTTAMHSDWAHALADAELADEVDGVAAGQLTPPERSAVLAEAARRLRRINRQAAAADDDGMEADDVEPTGCYWVE
jgi:hypothetical protein